VFFFVFFLNRRALLYPKGETASKRTHLSLFVRVFDLSEEHEFGLARFKFTVLHAYDETRSKVICVCARMYAYKPTKPVGVAVVGSVGV